MNRVGEVICGKYPEAKIESMNSLTICCSPISTNRYYRGMSGMNSGRGVRGMYSGRGMRGM